jgi:hypothetical protein
LGMPLDHLGRGPVPRMSVERGDQRLHFVERARRVAIGNAPITPTEASEPASSYRPSNSEPMAPSPDLCTR